MNINQIKPKTKGKSDKYSWQLYEYLRRNKYDITNTKVFFNTKSWFDGSKLEFDKSNLILRQIWIGYDDDGWFDGNNLNTIISQSKEKYEIFANPWIKNNYIDITNWFWNEYIIIGRCIWDREHNRRLLNDENRFTYVNNTRKCNWCGQWQHREIEKIVEIKREEKWVNN